MSTALTATNPSEVLSRVITEGNLSALSPADRVLYYTQVCKSIGLNPLTKPFDYINLNGKLTLYAKRDATDQLRGIHKVSVSIVSRESRDGVYVVVARATLPDGRSDESIGAVNIGTLKGDALANACMKAETKSKRRVTLSICGLGWLDETEVGASASQVQPHINGGPTKKALPHHSKGDAPPVNMPESITQAERANTSAKLRQDMSVMLQKYLDMAESALTPLVMEDFAEYRKNVVGPGWPLLLESDRPEIATLGTKVKDRFQAIMDARKRAAAPVPEEEEIPI